tara:strand:+ start:329 stop:517 length:189 start_codon:yes stop_codon:yes gene_type:complete
MTNQEASASIAFLADKVSKYHSRLLIVERELKSHKDNCKCHDKPSEKVMVYNEPEECEVCSA